MSQYFTKKENIENDRFSVAGSQARHIIKSARHKRGDIIKIFDGEDFSYLARISEISNDLVSGKIVEKLKISKPKTELTLCFALAEKKALDNIFGFCTQIGVNAFQPIITQRVQGYDKKNWDKKASRARRIFVSTCKQCERAILPKLYPPLYFDQAIKRHNKGLIACLSNDSLKISKALGLLEGENNISVFVGPPGDFTSSEVNAARARGLIEVSLGDNVLKTEVACIVASAIFAQRYTSVSDTKM
jgi:16S rRNA (uracil1498-N3)-methyltransferase